MTLGISAAALAVGAGLLIVMILLGAVTARK